MHGTSNYKQVTLPGYISLHYHSQMEEQFFFRFVQSGCQDFLTIALFCVSTIWHQTDLKQINYKVLKHKTTTTESVCQTNKQTKNVTECTIRPNM